MQIGTDFPKIEFQLFGLDLLEPNGIIGNTLIFLLSFFFFFKVKKLKKDGDATFIKNWRLFYLTFGITFFTGGLGHLFYNYFEVAGKIPSWFISFFSPYYIEQAMITIYPNKEKQPLFRKISRLKLILFICAEAVLLINYDISHKPELGLIIPSLSSILGLVTCLGVLGLYYKKAIHRSFINLWYAMLVLLFSLLPQVFKFNIHPYWDRNDLSHFLLLFTLILYYLAIKHYHSYKVNSVTAV
ncbi:MAG: hypothetical protein M9916_04390 [Crocinitomicaceae bacterium]|nr:hypothetical protein [Crocinitomicaceae bacterium]